MRTLTVKEDQEVEDFLSTINPALRYKLELFFKNSGSYNQGYQACERKYGPIIKAIKDVFKLNTKVQTTNRS